MLFDEAIKTNEEHEELRGCHKKEKGNFLSFIFFVFCLNRIDRCWEWWRIKSIL